MKQYTVLSLTLSLAVFNACELSALSNPFKKSDPSSRWQDFSKALNNYFSDTMAQMDLYANQKSTEPNKKLVKRFTETQDAFEAFKKSINDDAQKAKSIRSSIEQGVAGFGSQLNELKLVESLLLRRSAGLYKQIAATYAANELKMPASMRVEALKVYPFLKFTNAQGQKMSIDQINNTLKVWRGVTEGNKADRDSLFRQLSFYFQHRYSKQEFDAFINGEKAVKALELSNEVITFIQERFLEMAEISGMLDDIKHMIK